MMATQPHSVKRKRSLRARSARPSEASGEWEPRRALLAGGEGRSPSLTMTAVLLIAFGGPTRPEEIRPVLANVLRGREHRIPAERIEEVVRHYETIGGRSRLNEITLRQAARLETALGADGSPLPVFVGMRNWAPYLA